MSNSYRKTPIGGFTTARSEKQDKRIANRRFRRKTRLAFKADREPPFSIRQVCDIWGFAKDGKCWRGRSSAEPWFARFMRK